MKKLLSLTLPIFVIFIFSACGSKNPDSKSDNIPVSDSAVQGTPSEESNGNDIPVSSQAVQGLPLGEYVTGIEMTDNLFDCQVKIKNTVYQLPMSVEDFIKSGAAVDIKYEDENAKIEAYCTRLMWFKFSDGSRLNVNIGNFSKSEMPVKDCHVIQFNLSRLSSELKIDSSLISTTKGITINKSTAEDLKEAFGEPQHYHRSELRDTEPSYEGTDYYGYEKVENLIWQRVNFCVDVATNTVVEFRIENEERPKNVKENPLSTELPALVKDYKTPDALGDDILSGVFEVEGKLYRLPVPVSAFLSDGWEISEADSDTIAGGWHSYVELKKGDVEIGRFHVSNFEKYETSIENGIIRELTFYGALNEARINLPRNIKADMGYEQFMKALEGMDIKKDGQYIIVENEDIVFYGAIDDGMVSYAKLRLKDEWEKD